MNILDITQEDIARLQENKIAFGLLPERAREIFEFVGTEQCERYSFTGFFRCREGGMFGGIGVYRIRSDYTLPAPTEADIIKYLQASEVPPSQWHPAAREWAIRYNKGGYWEYKIDVWEGFSDTMILDFSSNVPYRLRADYGRKEPVMEDYCAIPAKEPEVCVWEARRKDPPMWYITCSAQASFCKLGGYCPYCGKRIEVKA